jgi:hypothetical protein
MTKEKHWKMISLSHLVFSLVLAGLAIWILVIIVRYYYNLFNPPHEIAFVAFEAAGGQKDQNAPQALSAKLRQLQLYGMQAPTGYGFLQMPVLATMPKEADKGAKDTLAELSKISLKIKDVDVNQLIKTVRELFTPPQYELSGRIVDFTNSVEISCEMLLGETPIRSWQGRSRYASAGTAADGEKLPDKAGAMDKVLDDILFQMIYDFLTKDEFKDWGISMKGEHRPGNWQTLQAYTRGAQALRAYQQNLDHTDLKEALSHLERMPVVAPDNAEGHYYYALALSEDRQEAEAVAVFEKVQRLLRARATDTDKARLDKMLLETRFNTETARLKLYRDDDGMKAKEELDKLIDEVRNKIANTPTEDPWYYKKLLAISYAQLAYTHGTLLVLLGQRQPASPVNDPEQRDRIIKEKIQLADKEHNEISNQKQWASDQEANDVLFRIRNAEGYSKFRYAQYQLSQKKIAQEAFVQECNKAISILEQAEQARPNHYEVLQDMAMIYEDKNFESSDRYLDTAETLYERTKRFVPKDYYQYERLAAIQWRRANPIGRVSTAKLLLQNGKEYAAQSLKWRPQATESLFLLARFNERLWEIAKDQNDSDAQKIANEAISYFKQALSAGPDSTEFLSAYRDFLIELNDLATQFESGSFLLELAKSKGESNKAELLKEAIDLLVGVIAGTTTDAAKDLNAKAQKAHDEATALRAAIQTVKKSPRGVHPKTLSQRRRK